MLLATNGGKSKQTETQRSPMGVNKFCTETRITHFLKNISGVKLAAWRLTRHVVAAASVTAFQEVNRMSVWACGLGSTTSFGFYYTAVRCCWPWDFTVYHYSPTHKMEKVISALKVWGCYLYNRKRDKDRRGGKSIWRSTHAQRPTDERNVYLRSL